MGIFLTNEDIDNRLIGKTIQRVGDYVSSKTKIDFECANCKYIWMVVPSSILQGSGCPSCSNKIRLTNAIIDGRLKNRSVKRIGDFSTNNKTPIIFGCLVCHCQWSAIPNNVMRGAGCPKCGLALRSITQRNDIEMFITIAKEIHGSLYDYSSAQYINTHTKVKILCTACKTTFEQTPDHHLRGQGCSECNLYKKQTNEDIDVILTPRKIKRIDDYTNANTKITFQCLVCKTQWRTTPSSIINMESGCPDCSVGKNERLVGSTLISNGFDIEKHLHIRDIIPSENRRMYIDIFLPRYSTIIEYNGDQHYRPVCFGIDKNVERAKQKLVEQQERDHYLQTICDHNKIYLIWIDGRKYTNSKLSKYVEQDIIPRIRTLASGVFDVRR